MGNGGRLPAIINETKNIKNNLMDYYHKKFDIAVIGAGPTGVFSAKVLTEAGLSVALICERTKGPKRHNYKAYSPNIQYDHYSGFGGGTHLWANVCRPHDFSDYKNFSVVMLYPSKRAYLQAEKFLGVENGSIFWHSATQPKIHENWKKKVSDKIEFLAYVYPKKIKKKLFDGKTEKGKKREKSFLQYPIKVFPSHTQNCQNKKGKKGKIISIVSF